MNVLRSRDKRKGEWRDEVVPSHTTDIKGYEEDKSEITKCKDERKKYLFPSLSRNVFISRFNSSMIPLRVRP